MTRLHLALGSHRGLVRTRNEDALGLGGWLLSTDEASPLAFLFDLSAPGVDTAIVLADGLGGHAAGDKAAALTARLASAPGHLRDNASIATRMAEVDQAVAAAAAEDPAWQGMGSTAVGLATSGDQLLIFNVGDSRAYRLDAGYLGQLSTDDRRSDEEGGLLTAAIGHGRGASPHVTTRPLSVAARYLLCSDGLWDVVEEETIETLLGQGTPAEAAGRLIEQALADGGTDNVTVAVVDTGVTA